MAKDEWEPGAVIIDGSGNVAEKAISGDGWFVLGWIDQLWQLDDMEAPFRRLVPEPAPVGKPGRPDSRLFRLTRQYGGHYDRDDGQSAGHIEYCGRISASQKCSSTDSGYSRRYGRVVKVEATNADATAGWTDVTEEFLGVQIEDELL